MLYLEMGVINHTAITHVNKRRRPGAPVPSSTALALIGFLIFCLGISEPGWPLEVNQAFARTPALTNDPILSLFRPYTAPKGDLMEYFAMEHAPIYDMRMAEGLVEAIGEYARLFPAGQAGAVGVTYSQTHVSVNDWLLAYDIKAGAQSAKVELTLTTDPDRIASNIPAMAKALVEAVEKMKSIVKSPAEIKFKKGDAGKIAARAMAGFDNASFIGALNDLGAGVSADSLEPEALLEAGNLFSWLCYFKSIVFRPNLGQIIAPHAIANHLTAGLFIKEGDERLLRARGLLLLGLGYPAAAITAMAGLPHVERELTYVTATRDLDQLDRAAKAAGASPRLAAYLDARLTNVVNGHAAVIPKFEKLAAKPTSFFDFELAITQSGVPLAGLAPVHLILTSQNNMKITENMFLFGASAIPPIAQIAWETLFEGNFHKIEVALKLQTSLLREAKGLKNATGILTLPFLSDYLEEDAKNAAYLCFIKENDTYARLESAKSWADIIGRVWPDSMISALAALKYERKFDQYNRIAVLVKNVPMDRADSSLLKEYVSFYYWNNENHDVIAKGISALHALRLRTDPTADNITSMAYYWKYSFFNPTFRDYIQRAIKLDPYNPYSYYYYLPPGAEKLASAKGHPLEHSSVFLNYASYWLELQGRLDEAIALEKKALALPGVSKSPEGLVKIHEKAHNYAEAERLMKEYLKNDDGSFIFIEPKNILAQIYLQQNKSQEAFDLMNTAKDSWQGGALINYARAAELLGKFDLAEKYFSYSAQRYPAGQGPVYLAMYHLRRADRAKAVATLKEYKKHNHFTYYFKRAVWHFKKANTPEAIMDFVTEVEGEAINRRMMNGMYDHLMQAGLFELAAKSMRPFIRGAAREMPYFAAFEYANAASKANPSESSNAIHEAIEALSDNPRSWIGLAMLLHENGYYREAFDLFPAWGDAVAKKHDDSTVMMAASWKALGGDPALKPAILARLNKPGFDPWRGMLTRYYMGEVTEAALTSEMTDKIRAVQSFYAMAAERIAKGETEEAEKLMMMTMETQMSRYLVFGYARNFLKEKSWDGLKKPAEQDPEEMW
ncbi:MAG: hypothetical protein OEV92_03340 [Nitrospinota bacterium]|nr:hypothetical protein [Nitrospinota bacterium]